jgi:hypothetical protein
MDVDGGHDFAVGVGDAGGDRGDASAYSSMVQATPAS